MKVVSVGWMGVRLDFPNATFSEEQSGALTVKSMNNGEESSTLAVFPAGKWDCAINEERPDVTQETLEDQLKNEKKRTESVAMAASEGYEQ